MTPSNRFCGWTNCQKGQITIRLRYLVPTTEPEPEPDSEKWPDTRPTGTGYPIIHSYIAQTEMDETVRHVSTAKSTTATTSIVYCRCHVSIFTAEMHVSLSTCVHDTGGQTLCFACIGQSLPFGCQVFPDILKIRKITRIQNCLAYNNA